MITEPDPPSEPVTEMGGFWMGLREPDDGKPLMELVNRLAESLTGSTSLPVILQGHAERPIFEDVVSTLGALSASLVQFPVPVVSGGHDIYVDIAKYHERVVKLLPKTPEEIAAVEQAVVEARVDPEKRELVQHITGQFARPGVQRVSKWGVVLIVLSGFIKVAESANPNLIGPLGIAVSVVIYLAQSGFFNP